MLHKFYYFHLFFVLFCGFSEGNSRREDGNIQIIFATAELSTEWISGVFHCPQSARGRWHAFLIPPNHELAWKTGGLTSFNHRSEIIDQGFEFRYLTKGEWVVGAFQDLNRNTLLDLGTESFYIAKESPVLFSGEAIHIEFGVRERSSQKLILRNFPEEYPWAVQVMDEKQRPLFARSFSLPELIFFDMSVPFHFVLAEDRNENGFLENDEFEEQIYKVEKILPEGAVLHYGQPWLPVNIGIEKPAELDVFLVQEQGKTNFRLPVFPDDSSNFFHYDLAVGNYQLEFSSKLLDGSVFRSRSFVHPAAQKLEFVFSADYKMQCRQEISQAYASVGYAENPPVYLSGQNFCGRSLFQPGSYRVAFYDYFPVLNDFSSSSPSDLKDPLSSPALSLKSLQNVEIYVFSLDEKNKSLMLDDLVMENQKTRIISGQYKFGREKIPKGAKLYFFQYPEGMRNMEILDTLNLSAHKTGDMLEFSFALDDRDLFSFVDFNGNVFLDDEEKAFSRAYGKLSSSEPLLLEFPDSRAGVLRVSFTGAYPERHFLEVYLADEPVSENSDENSTETDFTIEFQPELPSPPLAAAFLSSKPLIFANMPQLLNLRLRLVFDINNNGSFDEEDIFYPEEELLIPFWPQILELNFRLHSGQLFIETKSG